MTKEKTCTLSKAISLVGDMWNLLIIKNLLDGSKRFCQLQDSLVQPESNSIISSKTLSERLKLLEAENVINRRVFAEVPVKVEYTLTEKGQALSGIIEAIDKFGKLYM